MVTTGVVVRKEGLIVGEKNADGENASKKQSERIDISSRSSRCGWKSG